MLQRGYRMPKPQHLDDELYVKMRASLILYYISFFFLFQLALFNQEFLGDNWCATSKLSTQVFLTASPIHCRSFTLYRRMVFQLRSFLSRQSVKGEIEYIISSLYCLSLVGTRLWWIVGSKIQSWDRDLSIFRKTWKKWSNNTRYPTAQTATSEINIIG